jgi:hypothetical protein
MDIIIADIILTAMLAIPAMFIAITIFNIMDDHHEDA